MARLGKTAEFRDGLRVTDAETVDIARMVLLGQVNPQLVAAINVHGNFAVGVSGEAAGLLRATQRDEALGLRRRDRLRGGAPNPARRVVTAPNRRGPKAVLNPWANVREARAISKRSMRPVQ